MLLSQYTAAFKPPGMEISYYEQQCCSASSWSGGFLYAALESNVLLEGCQVIAVWIPLHLPHAPRVKLSVVLWQPCSGPRICSSRSKGILGGAEYVTRGGGVDVVLAM
jgi:hypothetical protein